MSIVSVEALKKVARGVLNPKLIKDVTPLMKALQEKMGEIPEAAWPKALDLMAYLYKIQEQWKVLDGDLSIAARQGERDFMDGLEIERNNARDALKNVLTDAGGEHASKAGATVEQFENAVVEACKPLDGKKPSTARA